MIGETWPKTCGGCSKAHFNNPVPVAVALVPVLDEHEVLVGFVGVKRGAKSVDGAGQWALPGGFTEFGEDAKMGGARELREETGIDLPPAQFRVIDSVCSTNGANILTFVVGSPVYLEQVLQATPCENECMAVGVVDETTPLAFSSHHDVIEKEMDIQRRKYVVSRRLGRRGAP